MGFLQRRNVARTIGTRFAHFLRLDQPRPFLTFRFVRSHGKTIGKRKSQNAKDDRFIQRRILMRVRVYSIISILHAPFDVGVNVITWKDWIKVIYAVSNTTLRVPKDSPPGQA